MPSARVYRVLKCANHVVDGMLNMNVYFLLELHEVMLAHLTNVQPSVIAHGNPIWCHWAARGSSPDVNPQSSFVLSFQSVSTYFTKQLSIAALTSKLPGLQK